VYVYAKNLHAAKNKSTNSIRKILEDRILAKSGFNFNKKGASKRLLKTKL